MSISEHGTLKYAFCTLGFDILLLMVTLSAELHVHRLHHALYNTIYIPYQS
jgi:hypothetical protein